jgi:predicted nucleic acid-binding protein
MKALFVDTAGWVACADAGDPLHAPEYCTSFVVARELRIREALKTDHHFAQAGFIKKP